MERIKQFNLIEYYNTVVNYLEENKVSSEEGNKRIDRFIIRSLDNEHQTFFKDPIFLTNEAFEKLKDCFFEEFKPIFTQYYKPAIRDGGLQRMNEYVYAVSFDKKESEMIQDKDAYTKRLLKNGIKEVVKPQALEANEAARKKAKEEGKEGDEVCTPYIEFILEDKGNKLEILRKLCSGFKLTEDTAKKFEGAIVGEYQLVNYEFDKEKFISRFTVVALPEVDPIQKQVQVTCEKIFSDLKMNEYELKDLMNVRFTGQPMYIHMDDQGSCQIPKAFGDEKRPQVAMTLSDTDFPGYLVDTIELRNEKQFGYSDEDKDCVYIHLRKKLDETTAE